MRLRPLISLSIICFLLISFAVLGARQANRTAPGGLSVPPLTQNELLADKGGLPEGFTSIFNGKDLTGWHISKSNSHGTTPDYHVVHWSATQ